MGPGRLHALVDGVFAIAVTLLVLDLPHPGGSDRLAHDLLAAWPTYVAYLVSFVTVGVLWIEHTGMLSAVRYVNRRLLERTLVFLLFISIIPWPTSLAAEYVTDGGAPARTVAVLYASVMLLLASSMTMSWRYLQQHPELVTEEARGGVRRGHAPVADREPGLHPGDLARVREPDRFLRARRARRDLLRALAQRGARADPPRRRRGRGLSTRTPSRATVALSAPPTRGVRPMVTVILFRFRGEPRVEGARGRRPERPRHDEPDGGFVMEHVLRWDAAPDGRPYTMTDRAQIA